MTHPQNGNPKLLRLVGLKLASCAHWALWGASSLIACTGVVEDPETTPADVAVANHVEVAKVQSQLLATGSKTFVAFESGPVRPIAMSTDGQRLFAVNTPDNSLEIFGVAADGTLSRQGPVPVGLEPVAVAARNSNEVWVVNHLSDSVSVLDVSVNPARVTRTLLVGDEPRDIVFAGAANSRAFITTAHRGQHRTHSSISGVTGAGDAQLTTAGVPRADVWVFDPANLGTTMGATPLKIVTLFGDTPRALAVSPDRNTVYAAVLKSGNRTTSLISDVVCVGFGNTPCTISGNLYPAGVPGPADNYAHAPAPHTGNIVRFNVSTNKWQDQLGRDWSNAVKFTLPDKDVFAIDVNSLNESASYSGVGTTLFNMVTNPVNGKIYVSNIEANNFARFEGPGSYAGETLQGNLGKTRITVIAGGSVTPRHLNKHINYNARPAPLAAQQASLSMPLEMAITGDGSKLYVSAFGSSKVGVFDTAALENDTFDPTTGSANYIPVSGGGPAGLVLDEERGRLFVFTRFDNAISVVNPSTRSETQHIAMFNPEPLAVRNGRKFLYDALATSSNGEASCASCHIFGDNDDIAWNLGNPDDDVKTTPVNVKVSIGATGFTPAVNGSGNTSEIHPMKGPMTTQTLRGMQNHGHMHWRADRVSGFFGGDSAATPVFDERLSFKNFIVAFEGLLGRAGTMTDADVNKFADFALELVIPPNPVRSLDNSLNVNQARGKKFYMGCDGLDSNTTLAVVCSNGRPAFGAGHSSDGIPFLGGTGFTCEGCHRLEPANGFFGTDGQMSFEFLPQTMKIPHLRNLYTKVGMFGMPQVPTQNAGDNSHKGDQVRGFGYLHDGSVDTPFRFFQGTQFNSASSGLIGFSAADANAQRRDVEQFMLAFDNDIAPIVGQQVTLTSSNSAVVGPRIDLLKARATANFTSLLFGAGIKECDLVAKGVVGGIARGWLWRPSSSTFEPDDSSASITDATLRGYAATPGQAITFTCVPPGSGVRIALDRDADDRANRLDSCPDNASCGASACAAGTGNCDAYDGTACETNLNTSLAHCGGCGLTCDFANAAESCATGVCTLGACSAGYLDCDGVAANGCELNTATASCAMAGLVTAGDEHACALYGNGKAYCWGSNADGRLGDGTTTTRAAPTLVSGLSDLSQASAGSNFSCAVRSGGSVACWGNDGFGQLGNGGGGSTTTPGTVSLISNARSVSTNGGADIGYHACALQATGDVACWGKGGDGQLGNGAFSDQQTRVLVTGINNAVGVASGRNYSCAVLRTGQVKCWGRNDVGQLGNGTTTSSASPVAVLDLGDAARIAAGRDFSCAVRTNGRVKCWGSNSDGQLGDGTLITRTSPVKVSSLTNARIVSLGDDHACATLTDGTARCWGRNASGQLGNNTTSSSSVPVTVAGLTNLKDIAAGDDFSCAMQATTQEVFCWGSNGSRQLGDGTTTQRNAPVSASGFPQIAPESNCLYARNAGHIYWMCDTQRTYTDARSKCQALGFDLLVVNASSESSYVDGLISSDYWAGYSDTLSEGSWKWVDGTTPGHPNWSPGEPNGGSAENCGSLFPNAALIDRSCADNLRYICEDPVP